MPIYPYHMHLDKVRNIYHNPAYPDAYHSHTFKGTLLMAGAEREAFYLSDGDRQYYTQDQLHKLNRVLSGVRVTEL